MAITTLSMVLTAFALNLHYITDRPVPLWLHRLVFVYIAKLVGKRWSRMAIAGSIRNKKRALVAGRDCRKPSEPCPEGSAKSTSRRRAQIRISHSADDRQFSSAVVEIQEPASADSGVAIRENGPAGPERPVRVWRRRTTAMRTSRGTGARWPRYSIVFSFGFSCWPFSSRRWCYSFHSPTPT